MEENIENAKKQQKGERDGWKLKSQRELLNITPNRLKNKGKKDGRNGVLVM